MSIRGLGKAAVLAVLAFAALPGTAFGALELTVTPAPVPVVTGDRPSITAKVSNTGDALEELVAISFLPQDDATVTAVQSPTSCFPLAGGISCPVGDLAPGQSASVTVTYGALKPETATLWVIAPNAFVEWSTSVTPLARLTLDLAGQPASLTAGNETAVAATVKNTGAGPAWGATLRIALPFGLSPGALPSGCSAVGLSLTCSLGDLTSLATSTTVIPIKPPEAGTYTVLGTASWARPPIVQGDLTVGVLAPVGPDDGSGGLPTDIAGAATPAVPKTVTIERLTRGLPGRNRCVRGRMFDVLLRSSGEVDPKSAVVRIGKKVVKRLKGAKARAPFTIRVPRPRSRRFVLRVSVTLTDGRILNAGRTYVVCRRR